MPLGAFNVQKLACSWAYWKSYKTVRELKASSGEVGAHPHSHRTCGQVRQCTPELLCVPLQCYSLLLKLIFVCVLFVHCFNLMPIPLGTGIWGWSLLESWRLSSLPFSSSTWETNGRHTYMPDRQADFRGVCVHCTWVMSTLKIKWPVVLAAKWFYLE